MKNDTIRNIAIIAHVDHGKTTLVDAMFKQSGMLKGRELNIERVMDNLDLERERGITIAAKNCEISLDGIRVNILDTPGHADFGGEVERALVMADGAILLVDASEGPLPQTRFVLKKALERNLKIMVVINKIDRKDARPDDVLDEIIDLFIALDVEDHQLDFPVLYAIGRDGIAKNTVHEKSMDLKPLFEAIVKHMPAPEYKNRDDFQMLVSDLGYSDYSGRLAIGKIHNGSVHRNDDLVCIDAEGNVKPLRVSGLQMYEGMKLTEQETGEPGDIVVLAGIEDVKIGDTICNKDHIEALPRISVDKPVVSMEFTINSSPYSGRDGQYVQSSRIKERLFKETLRNVSIEVEQSEDANVFLVKGRGELQIAVLIESMRREGFELSVGKPKVIFKEQNGKLMEPMENLIVDTEDAYIGVVTEKLSQRKGVMTGMVSGQSGRTRIEFKIPSRGLIGYRNEFLTDTRGTGIINAIFAGYESYKGDIEQRSTGSLVSDSKGTAMAYALYNLEPRGQLFIRPNDLVYEGMVIGEHAKSNDLNVNPLKQKKLSNMRAAGRDDNIMLTPVKPMTLERAIEYIGDDELVEVTPSIIRIRKRILGAMNRKRDERKRH
ncbi:MAG: translational GTPase TypA [bacterium]